MSSMEPRKSQGAVPLARYEANKGFQVVLESHEERLIHGAQVQKLI